MRVCQKSHIALIFLMLRKNYPNYKKLAKTKKNYPKHENVCPNVTKYFFLPKKKMHFSKKLQFFPLRKGNLCRKILFIFLRFLTHNFERIHHETNWSNSGLGGLFYFILFLIWWNPLKILLIFNSLYICVLHSFSASLE